MYLKRTIDSHLKEWADDSEHKPLLLRGARQIGKTTAVRHLAECFESFIEINFEKTPALGRIFEGGRIGRVRDRSELPLLRGASRQRQSR